MRERIISLNNLKKTNCAKLDKKCAKTYDDEIKYIQNEIKGKLKSFPFK
jgi:hypothetical protein